ncbi:hypothetical protein KUCAC02_009678 [Chaenocephalus aceratus]|nr:hypothetical protein KUCAC02_009678 [Chaenocephalus aceratus]
MVHLGVFVLGFSLALWSFTAAHTEDKGRRLIGPGQPIEASEGDDVILPCSVSPDYNVEDLTVEWSLPDLKPDPSDRLSRVDYVRVPEEERGSGHEAAGVRREDGAVRGRAEEGGVKEAVVRLVVEPRANSTLTTETQTNSPTPDPNRETGVEVGRPPLRTLVLCACIVLLVVVAGFGVAHFLLKRCAREKETKRCII